MFHIALHTLESALTVVLLTASRFGEESEEADEGTRPVRTSWAVLFYLTCLGGYLAFLFVDMPELPPRRQFAIKVRRRQTPGFLREPVWTVSGG